MDDPKRAAAFHPDLVPERPTCRHDGARWPIPARPGDVVAQQCQRCGAVVLVSPAWDGPGVA